MGARPLIGVSTSEVRVAESIRETPEADPARHEMALGMKYLRSIELAGGLPVVMPPLAEECVSPLLDHLAGICLPGGPDIHPSAYGCPPHAKLGPTEPGLDRFELAVAREADARDMPILAICRGAQALNVARGGTLIQHLPDVSDELEHRQAEPANRATHSVRIEAGSRLARAVGREEAMVNSFHHQASRRLGGGLRPVAWSADGIVEGIEAVDRGFVVGVQWHAEGMVERHPEQAALFAAFVDAASRYGDLPAPARMRAA